MGTSAKGGEGNGPLGAESLQPLGAAGLYVPPIIFGTSAFGNLYGELPYETKLGIARQWFSHVAPPVVLDSAGKYGAGLALEMIGSVLRDLKVSRDQLIISNKLGWKRVPLEGAEPTFEPGVWANIRNDAVQRISYEGILECWEEGNALLGGDYHAELLSVHDPDEYVADAAADSAESKDRLRLSRFQDVVGAYRALQELKRDGKALAIGVGAKEWNIIRELVEHVSLDWVMLACSLTLYRHPPELLAFIDELVKSGVGVINSAVFHSGFLIGGEFFDYHPATPAEAPQLHQWRERFFILCEKHDVAPAAACIQFGISHPGVVSVALNTSNPTRVSDNVAAVRTPLPSAFWSDMKVNGLIDASYPYIG